MRRVVGTATWFLSSFEGTGFRGFGWGLGGNSV